MAPDAETKADLPKRMFRLHARIDGELLLDIAVPRYSKRGHLDQWILDTDEVLTARGLPLTFYVQIGIRDQIAVVSAGEVLLTYYMGSPLEAMFKLLLPTNETLLTTINDRPLN